ncbi:MAG: DUF3185 domain-containing protein [Gemmatimonadota bacterium]
MKVATLVGLILIVLGAVGFALGGFSFTRREKVLDLGPIQATAERRHSVPVSPILSGIAVVGGVFLVVVGMRRV